MISLRQLGGWIIVGAVVGFTYTQASNYFAKERVNDGVVSSTSEVTSGMTASKDFVGVCSGMDISDAEVHLIAVSECMGRVRGFVDGHHLTVAMNRMAGAKSVNLWCMPDKLTSGQLLTEVMDWADTHPDEYVKIRTNVDDNNSATAVMIEALHTAYPCVNS